MLFGVEIDTDRESGENYHFVSIFDESLVNCCNIADWINQKTNLKKIAHKVRYTSKEIIELIRNYNVVIVPHGDKQKGLLNRPTEVQIRDALKKVRDGFIRVFDSPSDWKLERIKSLIEDGTIENFDDNFGGVLFSDNRDWLNYNKNFRNFCMNAEPTFKGFLHAITNPVHRFLTKDLIPSKSKYISKIEIRKNNEFARIDDCDIYLDSGYNCIIGKSGSGKSLLHFLIESKIVPSVVSPTKYSFSSNNEIIIYDENNNIITPAIINVGIGDKIFDKIITASTTKESSDMYKVISILNKDFKRQVKFNSYVENYKNIIKKYVNLNERVKETAEDLNTNFITFESKNIELNNMKNIHTFTFDIPENVQYDYSNTSISKLKEIYSKLQEINDLAKYFKEETRIEFLNRTKELENYYIEEMRKIVLKANEENLINSKRELIRKALTKVNAGISSNAKKKTDIINSMNTYIGSISSNLLEHHLIKKAIAKYDLSINIESINLEGELIPNSGITFSEKIDQSLVQKLDIKTNSIFYTRGIQQSLNSKKYDVSTKNDAKTVIDEYIRLGKMTESDINKLFSEVDINVDVFFDNQNVKELNPGDISKKYIKTYFEKELANGINTIILYDQIENDVDKPFISNTLIEFIEDMKRKAQLIIVTHDPIVAVNADPTNYVEATKNNNGLISYRSFKPESEVQDELSTIAKCVDGSKNVIKERYEIYRGDKTYAD